MGSRLFAHVRQQWIAVVALFVALAGGSALAAIPDSDDGEVHLCYKTVNQRGDARVIDHEAGQRCTRRERELVINQSGPTGPAGPSGPTGPAGPSGTSQGSDFGYIFNVGAQTVPIEADVTFDRNGVLSPGFTHTPGTSELVATTPGAYEIGFSVSGIEPNQFAIFVNGAASPIGVYGSGAGTQQNTGHGILTLAAGDVVTLRNHSSAAAVTLQTFAGGTQDNVNASILIEKLD